MPPASSKTFLDIQANYRVYIQSADSYLCFRQALLIQCLTSFFSPSSSLCTVFDIILSNMRWGLSINPSANLFVFADFDVHRKDWLTNFGRTDRHGELCYDFSISNDLTQMVNFPNRIPDCYHHSHALWFSFFLLTIVFILEWLSLHWKFWSCCCLCFHWLSVKLKRRCNVSSHSLRFFLCWVGWSSRSFERCSMGGYL